MGLADLDLREVSLSPTVTRPSHQCESIVSSLLTSTKRSITEIPCIHALVTLAFRHGHGPLLSRIPNLGLPLLPFKEKTSFLSRHNLLLHVLILLKCSDIPFSAVGRKAASSPSCSVLPPFHYLYISYHNLALDYNCTLILEPITLTIEHIVIFDSSHYFPALSNSILQTNSCVASPEILICSLFETASILTLHIHQATYTQILCTYGAFQVRPSSILSGRRAAICVEGARVKGATRSKLGSTVRHHLRQEGPLAETRRSLIISLTHFVTNVTMTF